MKKVIYVFLAFSIFNFSNLLASNDESDPAPTPLTTQTRAAAASASSNSAISISMVTWGIVGAAGITALAIAVHHSTSHS